MPPEPSWFSTTQRPRAVPRSKDCDVVVAAAAEPRRESTSVACAAFLAWYPASRVCFIHCASSVESVADVRRDLAWSSNSRSAPHACARNAARSTEGNFRAASASSCARDDITPISSGEPGVSLDAQGATGNEKSSLGQLIVDK